MMPDSATGLPHGIEADLVCRESKVFWDFAIPPWVDHANGVGILNGIGVGHFGTW